MCVCQSVCAGMLSCRRTLGGQRLMPGVVLNCPPIYSLIRCHSPWNSPFWLDCLLSENPGSACILPPELTGLTGTLRLWAAFLWVPVNRTQILMLEQRLVHLPRLCALVFCIIWWSIRERTKISKEGDAMKLKNRRLMADGGKMLQNPTLTKFTIFLWIRKKKK